VPKTFTAVCNAVFVSELFSRAIMELNSAIICGFNWFSICFLSASNSSELMFAASISFTILSCVIGMGFTFCLRFTFTFTFTFGISAPGCAGKVRVNVGAGVGADVMRFVMPFDDVLCQGVCGLSLAFCCAFVGCLLTHISNALRLFSALRVLRGFCFFFFFFFFFFSERN
jgi:hypothetical protein